MRTSPGTVGRGAAAGNMPHAWLDRRGHPESVDLVLAPHREGHTPQAIADVLNIRRVSTVTGRGRWHHTSARNLLRRLEAA